MSILKSWANEWVRPKFRLHAALTVAALVATLVTLSRFLQRIEERPGVVLTDPFLPFFPPVDVNWITFALIYVGLVSGIVLLVRTPHQLLLAFQTYVVLVIFRMIAMTLVPLDPPTTMIPLRDPTVQYLGTGVMLNKDLFFSGHTSTMFLLCLTALSPRVKGLYLACTIAVGSCVLIQHTHYTIDVYVAPFFAYTSYRIVVLLRSRFLGT